MKNRKYHFYPVFPYERTPDDDGLIAQLLDQPLDRTTWLVYADYIEERGHVERSAFLRRHLEFLLFFVAQVNWAAVTGEAFCTTKVPCYEGHYQLYLHITRTVGRSLAVIVSRVGVMLPRQYQVKKLTRFRLYAVRDDDQLTHRLVNTEILEAASYHCRRIDNYEEKQREPDVS